jgi:hypothetical protein
MLAERAAPKSRLRQSIASFSRHGGIALRALL